jgi:predicted enzyme related to lactoylglutathione lyase
MDRTDKGATANKRSMSLCAVLLGTLLLAACGTVSLPPVTPTPTDQIISGKFVWHDLLTDDVTAARQFYGSLFGWQFQPVSPDYMAISHNDVPVGGIARRDNIDPDTPDSLWLCAVSVADVDQAVDIAAAGGGQIVLEPHRLTGRGRSAIVRDPQGALIILLRAKRGDPPDNLPPVNHWIWDDLFTKNTTPAAEFYAALAGYDLKPKKQTDKPEYYLVTDNRLRAGIVKLQWKGVRPNWLPYVRVDNLDHTLRRAKTLGGDPIIRIGNTAIIIDPTGAAFGIQQHPQRGKEATHG